MTPMTIEEQLTPAQLKEWQALNTPEQIQQYLDDTPYSPQNRNRCVANLMSDRIAHCLDGGLFAAARLRRLGFPALIVDLLPDPGRDDDHVLAIYRVNGRYGALAKSNFSGLRSRQPVYAGLRELVMSYFEDFFNSDGDRTLRGYTRPVRLSAWDRVAWETSDAGVDVLEQHLLRLKSIPLLSEAAAAALPKMDDLGYRAGMLGVNQAGLYVPGVGHATEE